MKTPILETERLILRPISLDDAAALQKHFNDWEIIKYLSGNVPWPYPDYGTNDFLENIALPNIKKGRDIMWVLVPKDGADKGNPIGNIHYRLVSQVKDSDRGFWLGRAYHGQGLMTEAVCATQDYMFFKYGLTSFRVRNVQSNIGSHRIKEKTGASFIRLEDEPCGHIDGPTEIWEVTRENWAKIRGWD